MEVKIDYLAIGKRIRTARLSKEMTQEMPSSYCIGKEIITESMLR